jgi:hypothetical protein
MTREDREFITCTLPRGSENWRPDPFPGSDVAAARGCNCPVTQPWPGRLTFAIDCPVHELESTKQ